MIGYIRTYLTDWVLNESSINPLVSKNEDQRKSDFVKMIDSIWP